MTVYLEFVFLSNFFIDIFIFHFTLTILKSEIDKRRIIFSGIIGGLLSAILPFIRQYEIIIRIFSIILFPMIIKKHKIFVSYFITLCVFIVITLFLGGTFFAIKCIVDNEYIVYFSYGLIPILFSVSGIIVIYFSVELKKYFLKERNYNSNFFKIKIYDGHTELKTLGFFDTGNRVFAKNGEPVTIVGEKVYNMFSGTEEPIYITTVSGKSVLYTKDVELKIYSDSNNSIIYKTKIASAPNLGEKDVILNGQMTPEVK